MSSAATAPRVLRATELTPLVPPEKHFGRKAVDELITGALGGLGLGILWITIAIVVFFTVFVGLLVAMAGVLYGICQLVGA